MKRAIESFIKKNRKSDLLKKFSTNYPTLAYYTVYLPVNYVRFSNERKLENGKAVSSSESSSIILFTIQKCASTLVTKILKELSTSKGMVHIDFDSYYTTVSPKKYELFNDETFQKNALKPKGYYYGAWRHYRTVPNIENYRVLLILRDPRDVLTSMYFSNAYSHSPVSKKLVEKRTSVREMDIEEFVLQKAPLIKDRYADYIQHLLNKPSVLFLRYEDMVGDFPTWINELAAHTYMDEKEDIIQHFIESLSFKVEKEDKHSHIRNIQPGDYLRKLSKSTIEELNAIFGTILTDLGYE